MSEELNPGIGPENISEAEPISIINQELLHKVAEYFRLLDNPDADLNQEQAEEEAGKYFAENIAGKYSDAEINIAMWMSS
jgi:hypothetical protein